MDEFGTDALRFTLLVGSSPGNDMNLSLKKVEGNRNFANKVWNMTRFIIGAVEKAPTQAEAAPLYTLADSWIWARMNELIRNVDRLFENHLYGEAGRQIYDFLWSAFADWYLEIAKLQIEAGGDRAFYTAYTLVQVLDTCLRLLHPFTPFFTEEAWQYLKQAAQEKAPAFNPRHGAWEEALIIARWPEAQPEEGWENQKIADFSLLQEVVRAIRNLRAEQKINPGILTPAVIAAGERLKILQENRDSLISLAKIDPDHCEIVDAISEPPTETASTVTSGIAVYLLLEGLIDNTAEIVRLQREVQQVNEQIERLEKLLRSPFAEKAPAAVVEKEREKLATYRESAQQLQDQLQNLA